MFAVHGRFSKLVCAILLSAALVFSAAAPALAVGASKWYAHPLFGATDNLVAVDFVDANNGWIMGEDGEVWRTTDGGDSWAKHAFGPSLFTLDDIDIRDVDFVDANTGWAVGNYDDFTFGLPPTTTTYATIYKTTDGGVTWTRQDGSGWTGYLNALVATSSTSMMAVGEDKLVLRTSDGGTNWTQFGALDTAVDYNDVASGLFLYVLVGDGGAIRTWNYNLFTFTWTENTRASGTTEDLNAVDSASVGADTVYVAAGDSRRYTYSENAGSSWTSNTTPITLGNVHWNGVNGVSVSTGTTTTIDLIGDYTFLTIIRGNHATLIYDPNAGTCTFSEQTSTTSSGTTNDLDRAGTNGTVGGEAFAVGSDGKVAKSARTEAVRISGSSRYETAIEASKKGFADDSVPTVVIATGTSYADALSAVGLAGAHSSPLLLVGSTADTALKNELTRLGATKVFIVGGEKAVPAAVKTGLESAGFTVERIAGTSRYDTAVQVAREVNDTIGPVERVFLARGDNFADALAVSPLSYSTGYPILLTRPTALPSESITFLNDLAIMYGYVVGGDAAVTPDVKSQFDSELVSNGGAASTRLSGSNRYETAAVIASEAFDNDWAYEGVLGMATGAKFPDALGGGALMGQRGGALVLTRPTSLPAETETLISGKASLVGELLVFGGTSAVGDTVKSTAAGLIP